MKLAQLLCCAAALMAAVSTSARAEEAPLDRARRALEAGDGAEAVAVLEPLAISHADDGAVLHELGRAYYAVGRVDDAVDTLERALERRPQAADTHHLYGAALGTKLQSAGMFTAMRLAPKVKTSFQRAVELAPDEVGYRESLMQYYLLAPSIAGGGTDKARREADEIAKRDARRGTLALARVQLADDDRAGALATLEGAVARWPDDGALYVQTALLHHEAKQWPAAFAMLDQATRRDPGNLGAWYQLGRTAVLSGERLADGEAALKRYLAATPGSNDPPLAAAHWRLGMLYELKRQPGEARAEYEAALKLDADNKEAKAALKKLGKKK